MFWLDKILAFCKRKLCQKANQVKIGGFCKVQKLCLLLFANDQGKIVDAVETTGLSIGEVLKASDNFFNLNLFLVINC
jgi:hypothetical protein